MGPGHKTVTLQVSKGVIKLKKNINQGRGVMYPADAMPVGYPISSPGY
jgi:hypothetical protein